MVVAMCMRVEEEGSGGSVYETEGGGKWKQCVRGWRRRVVEAVCMRLKEEGSGSNVHTYMRVEEEESRSTVDTGEGEVKWRQYG